MSGEHPEWWLMGQEEPDITNQPKPGELVPIEIMSDTHALAAAELAEFIKRKAAIEEETSPINIVCGNCGFSHCAKCSVKNILTKHTQTIAHGQKVEAVIRAAKAWYQDPEDQYLINVMYTAVAALRGEGE